MLKPSQGIEHVREREAPFPVPSPLTLHYLKRTLDLVQLSFGRHWHPGTGGNFSVRDPRGSVWVSASGLHKGALTLRDFLPIDLVSAEAIKPSFRKPSDETALHCAIYRRDASARAVLHVHPPHSVALLEEPMTLRDNEMLKVFGLKTHDTAIEIPVKANTQDMLKLGREIGSELNTELKILVLAGHGVYAWGKDPDEAMYRIEALEYLCQLQILKRST